MTNEVYNTLRQIDDELRARTDHQERCKLLVAKSELLAASLRWKAVAQEAKMALLVSPSVTNS